MSTFERAGKSSPPLEFEQTLRAIGPGMVLVGFAISDEALLMSVECEAAPPLSNAQIAAARLAIEHLR